VPDPDPSELVFIVVAFEGPDGYSQAGGPFGWKPMTCR